MNGIEMALHDIETILNFHRRLTDENGGQAAKSHRIKDINLN